MSASKTPVKLQRIHEQLIKQMLKEGLLSYTVKLTTVSGAVYELKVTKL